MYRRRRGLFRRSSRRYGRRLRLRTRGRFLRSRRSRFSRFRRVRRSGRSFRRGRFHRRSRSGRRSQKLVPFQKINSHVFPKPSKRFTKAVVNSVVPLSVLDKECYSRVPLPLATAASGRICAWVVPFDPTTATSSSKITQFSQIYPFQAADLVSIYNFSFDAGGTSGSYPNFGFFAPLSTVMPIMPAATGTWWPMSQHKVRVGAFYTYTVTNTSNTPCFVTPYKVYARRNLDRQTYNTNILQEYLNNLWQSGLGTNATSTDESQMYNYFHANTYDLFDASTFCQQWKVKTKRPFVLNPGRSRSFSIRLKARSWSMREWFEDFIANSSPLSTDCPWARLKGVPEYIFRYTTGDGGAGTPNYWPNTAPNDPNLPDLTFKNEQPNAVLSVSYLMKYYVKPELRLGGQVHTNLGVIGMAPSVPGATKSIVDTDYVGAVVADV